MTTCWYCFRPLCSQAARRFNTLTLQRFNVFHCGCAARYHTWTALGILLCFLLAQTNAADSFKLIQRTLLIPERGEVTWYAIQMQTNQILFMPPPEWRLRAFPVEKKLVLTSAKESAVLSLRVVPQPGEKKTEIKLEDLRQQVRERYPKAKLLEEFECYTGDNAGWAFDLEPAGSPGRAPFRVRYAVVPMPGHCLEIEITAPDSRFKSLHPALVSFMNSLRSEVRAGNPQ